MEFKPITEDRYEDVIRHLRDNFADEPLNKAAKLCSRGTGHHDLEHHSIKTLEDNMSIMAVDENNKRKLQINDDENFKKIFQLLYTLNLKENIFEHFHVEKAFDIRILSVDNLYRGQGIAKGLVKHSEEVAREYDFELMKADATGLFSQKILKSNGFEVLSEQYYDKYVDEFGRILLPVESPHIKLQLLYKLLK
ncbi:Dopamine N-acetyltransferase [Eumeta japonica]|uniref:Dopamine N-acetyltransferase n=1 Tax=Eumeta variegata TaxID=151549 RepID=A0A4C1TAI0_EUMVA|nr:Dopamine N-acetyltransferase [Eumeta japonica]